MNQRILVVDDEPAICEMLSLYLSRHGYDVAQAANSEQTLAALGARSFDVVVLDIGLAEEDGLKLLASIKSQHPAVRVVMLTGMGFMEDLLQEAHQKGADGYVSKVLPLDELLLAIQRVLRTAPV